MFVVYSPEGAALAASVQQLPVLRVDPSTRINKVEDSELEKLNVDQEEKNHKVYTGSKALKAYHSNNNEEPQRRVVVFVAEIMSEPLITIPQSATLAQAYRLMSQSNVDYLPVTSKGSPIGLLTRDAVLQKVLLNDDGAIEAGGERYVYDVMHRQVISTERDTDIRHIAQVFTDYDIGAVMVANSSDEPIGIVTRGDLIRRLAKEPPIEIYI